MCLTLAVEILIICSSINDTFGNSYYMYVASSDSMIVNRELERLWKEKTRKLVFLAGDGQVAVYSNSVM